MVGNSQKWLKKVQGDIGHWEWSEVVRNYQKCAEMVENGQKWVVIKDSGWTWSEVV